LNRISPHDDDDDFVEDESVQAFISKVVGALTLLPLPSKPTGVLGTSRGRDGDELRTGLEFLATRGIVTVWLDVVSPPPGAVGEPKRFGVTEALQVLSSKTLQRHARRTSRVHGRT
jgi:hypothetical protein